MDRDFAEKLRRDFPDGEDWGWRSLKAPHAIFWNSNKRKRLTSLKDDQIFIALIWKDYYARQCGQVPYFYAKEKELWNKRFKTLLRIAAVLLLALFFNYFGDRNRNGIPDLVEKIFPIAFSTHISHE